MAILKTLDHPNIVRYHDSFEHKGRLWIVMEFADAGISVLTVGDLQIQVKEARTKEGGIDEYKVIPIPT